MGVLKTAVLSVLLVGAALAQYIPAGNGGAGGASGSYSAASAAISPGTSFFPPGGSLAVNTTETNVQGLVTVAGTIQNFSANLSAAPGTNKALVFTWRKNATNQVVTCTVSGASTNCTDSTHQFQVAANDLIDIQVVSSGTIASGTYTSGATVTGTTGQTCTVTPTNGGGTGTTITVALTGTNALAGGTALTVTAGGSGFTSAPTAATLGSGTATCSGTVVISTSLSGPAASVITMLWSTPGQQGPQGPAGSGTPAGTNGQIQYNNSSSFGGFTVSGDASLNTTTGVLTNTGLNGTALSGLGTGILKNTTGTGIPSIAVAADFPTLNQNTTGTAANLSGTPALPNGTTATTQTTADTSTDLATDAFVHNAISGIGGGTGNAAAIVTETTPTSGTLTYTAPSATAGTTVTFQAASNAPIVLNGNATITLASATPGETVKFLFKQDVTGGRLVTVNGVTMPVHTAANATTVLITDWDGANPRVVGGTGDAGYSDCTEGSAPGANPISGHGYVNCDSTRHTQTYLNNGGQTHIMPRTSGSTDQLAAADLSNGVSGAGAVLLQTNPSLGADSTPSAVTQSYTNDGTTGTGTNLIAKISANDTAVKVGTSDTEAVGICVSGCTTTGSAQIAISGTASCTFDNTSTAGDYVQISTGTAGDCHDAGSTLPTSGGVLIGKVASGGTAGMHTVALQIRTPGSTGGSGNPDLSTSCSGGVLGGGSADTLTCSGTDSLSTGAVNAPSDRADVQYTMTGSGTFTKIYAQVSVAAGAGETFSFHARKCMGGGAASCADSTITCSITGASATTCNDTAHTLTYAAGDGIELWADGPAAAAGARLSMTVN